MDESDLLSRRFASLPLDDEQVNHIENRILSFLKSENVCRVIPTADDIYSPIKLKKHSTTL